MGNPLRLMWSLWKAEIIFYLGLMLLVLVYPYYYLVELVVIILLPLLLFKLWKDHRNFKAPVLSEWWRLIWSTSLVVIILWYLQVWLGGLGVLGLIVLVVGLALWRVWKGRKLYNAFTRWGADRLKGKNKKDFDFKEEYK